MSRPLLLWLALALIGRPAAAAGPEKIAVLSLGDGAGISATEIAYLTDRIRGIALELDPTQPPTQFLVMTRENILEMLPPGVDLASCEGACEVETGRNIGADYVVTGEIIRFGDGLRASLRLYDTRTAALIAQQSASAKAVQGLEGPILTAARQIFRPIRRPARRRRAAQITRRSAPGAGAAIAEGPPSAARQPNPGPWLMMAGGGALIGVGVGLTMLNRDQGEQLQASPTDTGLAEKVDQSYAGAQVSYTLGGLMLGTGLLWWLVSDDGDEDVSGGPIIGPGAVGWSGRW